MPDQLNPEYCRREAQRMFENAETGTNLVLRSEFRKLAEHFEARR